MPIQLSCPECLKSFKIKDEMAGKKIRCPKCKTAVIEVPAASSAEKSAQVADTPIPSAISVPAGVDPNDPNEQWTFKSEEGDEFGPISRSELDAWFAEGRVTAECQVLRAGADQWQWASDLYPQLAGAAAHASDAHASAPTPAGSTDDAKRKAQSQQRGVIWLVAGILLFVFGGSGFGVGCCGCQINGFAFLTWIQLFVSLISFGGAVACAVLAGLDFQKMNSGKMDPKGKVLVIVGLVLCILASLSGAVGVCSAGTKVVGVSLFGFF